MKSLIFKFLRTFHLSIGANLCCNQYCHRKPVSRGLCALCYRRAYRLIKGGHTTWRFIGTSIGQPVMTRSEQFRFKIIGGEQ